MAQPERELVRDRERTRQAILHAAERAIGQKGTKVSLAEIASDAGVTKSGLMHHFPTRDELVTRLIEYTITRMWKEVREHVDISENRPGKFTRGYVRALTGGSQYLTQVFSPTGFLAALGFQDATQMAATFDEEDARTWNRAFDADGLPSTMNAT